MSRPDLQTSTEADAGRDLRDWSDPEPQPCKWCDSEGVLWLVGGGTEPCHECNGAGCLDRGF